MQPNYPKYKDALPEVTVSKIKQKLRSMNIETNIYSSQNSLENFYSLSVKVEGSDISVNGKGTTYEYALASAHAELMERLQNQSFFRLGRELRQEAIAQEGFFFAPDEVYKEIPELLRENNEWLKTQLQSVGRYKKELLYEWKGIYSYDTGCDFVCLPYMNLMTNHISHIPVNMLSKMYMSNGMCAGNSREEALVQGLSEVFERVVNISILEDKVTPPTIPEEYLMQFEKVYDMVKSIRAIDGANLIVKDCSLGKGYPVIGIILINEKEQNYFVKFGSHPVFEIALERCLTELLQGQNIWSMKGMQPFKLIHGKEDEKENTIGILVNGVGAYPSELFGSKPSYPFTPYRERSKISNEELLKELLEIMSQNGKHVYVRDVSFAGFHSYSVIVPHFSEIEKITDISSIRSYRQYVKLKNMVRTVGKLPDEQIKNLVKMLEDKEIDEVSVFNLIGVPCEEDRIWHYNSALLLKALLYYELGDYKESYQCFDKYLKRTMNMGKNKSLYTYYSCARDYIGAKAKALTLSEQKELLSLFYDEIMIGEIIEKFKGDPLKNFGTINCWDCEECRAKKNCQYKAFEEVYLKLKAEYAKYAPVQQSLYGIYKR